ncbi:FecCD family ABC transporter permease [Thiomicrorhabdus indica]|uniref:FecCD family ABC transporter permease n=1 Tax=Thiomicrorhabdus indica TaxID=2267253 RepID=UPI00102DF52D|nr:iron ABC transporter permease [Thiomicrorhabdus indica]
MHSADSNTKSLQLSTSSNFPKRHFGVLLLLCIPAVFIHLVVGYEGFGYQAFSLGLQQGFSESQLFVLYELRLPRTVIAMIVGAGLAVAGVALQALFRNPLAEPGLIGVSSSAAFGAVMIMVIGGALWSQVSHWQVAMSAFVFGIASTLLIYRLAERSGQTDVALMLLAGVAVNALMGAGTQMMMSIADLIELRNVTFWLMGSLANLSWSSVAWVSVVVAVSTIFLWRMVRDMNAFVLGESSARFMGYNTQRFKWQVIFFSALMVSSAVAFVGVIGFVGLVVPHIVRLWVGADHRWVLPLSALAGALLLVLADWFARVLIYPLELPIGLLMAFLGAPFFLWMLLKRRHGRFSA